MMIHPRRLVFLATLAFTALLATRGLAAAEPAGRLWVYFGNYSNSIYMGELDLATGKLGAVAPAGDATSAAFLAVHPTRPLLYAACEMYSPQGGPVMAFSIMPKTGKLKLLGQQLSGGAGPCHLVVDRGGRCAVVANYAGGNVECLPIREDGSLGKPSCLVQHKGVGFDPQRQSAPRAHNLCFDPAERILLAVDLGLDKIMIYRFLGDRCKLEQNKPGWGVAQPGPAPVTSPFIPTAAGSIASTGSITPWRPIATTPPAAAWKRSKVCPRCRPASTAQTRRPRSPCIRRASFCTARIAGTTASCSTPSTIRRASSLWWAIRRPGQRRGFCPRPGGPLPLGRQSGQRQHRGLPH